MAENATLTIQGVETSDGAKTIAEMSDEERRQSGAVTSRFPLTLKEARELLDGDETLRGILGDDFVNKYLAVNEVRSSFVSSKPIT